MSPDITLADAITALVAEKRAVGYNLRSAGPDRFRDTFRGKSAGQGGGAGDGELDAIVTRFAY